MIDAPVCAPSPHIPVLLDRVLAVLAPRDDALYVDGTFGAGGYSAALLQAARCRVVAIDRDPAAVRRGAELVARSGGRLALLEGCFGDMERLLATLGPGTFGPGTFAAGISALGPVAGITLDLGVSSMQIDDAERGFSFRRDGPLDMRMGSGGPSAAELVATLSEPELARLIGGLGEERFARRVARAIVTARRTSALTRTGELAAVIRAAVPKAEPGLDPATRSFQALRIAVNDELGELDRGLAAAERLLMPGGRLAVVSFHSLEDGRVKGFLRRRSARAPRGSRHRPATAEPVPSFTLLGARPVSAEPAEIARNPRARSARLRGAERTAAPSWPPALGPGASGRPGREA